MDERARRLQREALHDPSKMAAFRAHLRRIGETERMIREVLEWNTLDDGQWVSLYMRTVAGLPILEEQREIAVTSIYVCMLSYLQNRYEYVAAWAPPVGGHPYWVPGGRRDAGTVRRHLKTLLRESGDLMAKASQWLVADEETRRQTRIENLDYRARFSLGGMGAVPWLAIAMHPSHSPALAIQYAFDNDRLGVINIRDALTYNMDLWFQMKLHPWDNERWQAQVREIAPQD